MGVAKENRDSPYFREGRLALFAKTEPAKIGTVPIFEGALL
jgi:hypothetical protein